MQDQTPLTQNPEPQPQPQVVNQPATVTSGEVPGKKSKSVLYAIIGVIVLLVGFTVAIVALNSTSEEEPTTTTTAVSSEVRNTADLDKISQELDNADLDSYEADLQINDADLSEF